jgi:hypothetical protein
MFPAMAMSTAAAEINDFQFATAGRLRLSSDFFM